MSDSTKRRRLLDELDEINTIVESNSSQQLELSDENIISTTCSISSADLMNNSISTTTVTVQCPESAVNYVHQQEEQIVSHRIYWGYKKPLDSNEFLTDFCEEITNLINNGIQFKIDNQNVVTKKVILDTIVCDSPAKSFVLKIKGHVRFFSCTKCETEGQYMRNRLCFPKINALKRTHESFKNKLQEQHHLTNTTMTELIYIPTLDIIQIFSLDYMHLCCLGVIKKLVCLWLSKGSKNIRLSRQQINELNALHLSLRNYVTNDFPRKPRSLDEFSNWKATEFRLFVLYTGPVILKKVLNEKLYLNFLYMRTLKKNC
ncbi:hypothetical protein QTP88_006447 [Uroleucon formosanum]